MKRKLAITAIVALAIGFVGLAGGFTTTVAVSRGVSSVCRNTEGIKVVNQDDPLDLHIDDYDEHPWAEYFGDEQNSKPRDGWCGEYAQRTYGYTLNEEPWEKPCPFAKAEGYTTAFERRECEYKTLFDPRSTAMFAMGGAIIALLPLARKRVK